MHLYLVWILLQLNGVSSCDTCKILQVDMLKVHKAQEFQNLCSDTFHPFRRANAVADVLGALDHCILWRVEASIVSVDFNAFTCYSWLLSTTIRCHMHWRAVIVAQAKPPQWPRRMESTKVPQGTGYTFIIDLAPLWWSQLLSECNFKIHRQWWGGSSSALSGLYVFFSHKSIGNWHWNLNEFKVATVLEEQVLLGPTGNMWELTLAGQHLYGRHGTQTQATFLLSVCPILIVWSCKG